MNINHLINYNSSKFKVKCFRCDYVFEFDENTLDKTKVYDYIPCPKCGLVHQLVLSYGNKWYLMQSPRYKEALYYDSTRYL